MKVKLRTLKQEKYEIEIDGSETVSKLKDAIEERHSIPKSHQILIFSGKILENEKTIDSYKIEEKDFLVLMVKKPAEESNAEKKPASTPAPTPQSVQPPQPVSHPSPQPAQPAPQASQPASQPASQQLSPQRQPQPAAFVNIDENAIKNICEMGFPRDQAEAALRAAFGNSERAVEYLFNGIPEGIAPPVQAAPAQRPAQSPQPPTGPTQPAQNTPAQDSDVFAALKQHPQFPQLCRLAQTGGEDALKQILTYFQQTNPELIQLIAAHQNEFIQLLQTPVPDVPRAAPGGGAGRGAPGGPALAPPGVIRVQLTPEDEQIVNNFVGMGFDRNRVLEAYFLFEKDYTMTAEYLLNNPEDPDLVGGDGGGDGLYDDEEDEFDDGGGEPY